jgi:Ca2+/H+ antiporter
MDGPSHLKEQGTIMLPPAEMTTAFSAARRDHLDLSVGIALGSAAQIALFVAPVLDLSSMPFARRR